MKKPEFRDKVAEEPEPTSREKWVKIIGWIAIAVLIALGILNALVRSGG
jgi:hypothetical protein